jgi:hypothetical protein
MSDDLNIKLISNTEASVGSLEIAKKNVIALTACKKEKIFGLDSDGNLIIWNTKNLKQTTYPIIQTLAKIGQSGTRLDSGDICKIDCSSKGNIVALPDNDRQVLIIDTQNYTTLKILPKELRPYSVVKFSPNGKYLAAVTKTPDLKIYKCDDWTIIKEIQLDYEIVDLSWNPKFNQLGFTDWEGGLSTIDDVIDISEELISPIANITLDEISPNGDLKDEDNKMDFDNDIDIDNDLDNISLNDDGISLNSELDRSSSPQPEDGHYQVKSSFVPGSFVSTPTNQSILHFNTQGYIRLSNQEPSTISVNYFDTVTNQNVNLTNRSNHNIGYLNEYGFLLVKTEYTENDPSSIYFQTTTLVGDQIKWNLNFDSKVNILGCCLTQLGPLIITDDCRLHWFSKSGQELLIQTSHHQNFVSCASKDEKIFLLYADDYQYKFVVLEAVNQEHIKTLVPLTDVAIPVTDNIEWIGLSDEGFPMMFTSDGSFLVYHQDAQSQPGFWYPVLDIPYNKKIPFHYPIGGSLGQVYLVSVDRQDNWILSPSIIQETWSIPLVILQTKDKESAGYDSELVEKRIIIDLLKSLPTLSFDQDQLLQETLLDHDKLLIKYIYHTAKTNQPDVKTLDLCKNLTKPEDVQNVIKLVRSLQNAGLVQKLENYLEEYEDNLIQARVNSNGKRIGEFNNSGNISKYSR